METIDWTPPLRLLVALLLGLLTGLERESARHRRPQQATLAGVRTHALLSLLGFGCAWLHTIGVVFILPVGLLAVAALALSGYQAKVPEGRKGWTSEAAVLLTFVVGALALLADIWVAMALGVVGTLLLAEKSQFESYVDRLAESEFLAVVKFLLVTLIILPALPDTDFTRFQLNPRQIWKVVALVSSIGFFGYFLTKRLGEQAGLWLWGMLGGLVSSTAVTISAGRMAQRSPEQSRNALRATILASAVMYLRILALIALLNPAFVGALWWELPALSAVGFLFAFQSGGGSTHTQSFDSSLENPFEIKPAMIFGGLFVLLSVVTSLVKNSFGNAGLLTLAGLVGVTDIDPFILSLVQGKIPDHSVVAGAILLAMASNTLVKGIYFAVLAKKNRRSTLWRFSVWAVLHLPLLAAV